MLLQWNTLALLVVCAHAQTLQHLFSLKPTTPWAVTVPTIGSRVLNGVFTTDFALAVNSSTGAVTMLSNHTNSYFAFSSAYARIDTIPPALALSGVGCSKRQFIVTFSYTIPNTFNDACSRDGAGMEAFFVLGSVISTIGIPQGLGGAMTGGADLAARNVSNPKPWQFFTPASRAYYFSPPVYCDFNMGTECQFQMLNAPQFYYGVYKTVTSLSVGASNGFMTVTGMDSYYNGSKIMTLNATTAISWSVDAANWVGMFPPSGIQAPLIYIMETCLDVVFDTFDIEYTDVCQSYATSGGGATQATPPTARPTPMPLVTAPPLAPTTRSPMASTSPVTTLTLTTTTQQPQTSVSSLASASTSAVSDIQSQTASSDATRATVSHSSMQTSIVDNNATTTTHAPFSMEEIMSAAMSVGAKGGMNAVIFSVVGVAICCLFSLFMCCMFRKPIRRNDYVRRAYLATPGRRFLCRCLGSDMESEASRGERLLSSSSASASASSAASYLKDT